MEKDNTGASNIPGDSLDWSALFEQIASNAPIGVYVVQDGKFCYVNPVFQRITGYRHDELINTVSINYVHPDDRERVRSYAIRSLKGEPRPYEFRLVTKKGEYKWILETITPVTWKGEKASLGYFMDITERKLAEQALQESEAFSSTLLHNSPYPILVIDADHSINYVNPALEKLTGYSADELIGKTPPYPWWIENQQ